MVFEGYQNTSDLGVPVSFLGMDMSALYMNLNPDALRGGVLDSAGDNMSLAGRVIPSTYVLNDRRSVSVSDRR